MRAQQLTEEAGAGDQVLRLGGEEVEVRGVARGEAQAHGSLRQDGGGRDQARTDLDVSLTAGDVTVNAR
ncbi:hypothetical protein Cma02nite_24700 [Cellulomonas marina]|nr:hypothetical protein Cma02nite_24700 [Cellulomonas marina]